MEWSRAEQRWRGDEMKEDSGNQSVVQFVVRRPFPILLVYPITFIHSTTPQNRKQKRIKPFFRSNYPLYVVPFFIIENCLSFYCLPFSLYYKWIQKQSKNKNNYDTTATKQRHSNLERRRRGTSALSSQKARSR